jgi:hypothetical protein
MRIQKAVKDEENIDYVLDSTYSQITAVDDGWFFSND